MGLYWGCLLIWQRIVTSNRESGFGRYDVMIEPKDRSKEAFILEFKVYNPRKKTLWKKL